MLRMNSLKNVRSAAFGENPTCFIVLMLVKCLPCSCETLVLFSNISAAKKRSPIAVLVTKPRMLLYLPMLTLISPTEPTTPWFHCITIRGPLHKTVCDQFWTQSLSQSQNNALTALHKISHLFAFSHSLRNLAQNLPPCLPSRIACAMTK